MPLNYAKWMEMLRTPEAEAAWRQEFDRWEALTPAEQAEENKIANKRMEKIREHIRWLDYCVAAKIDPNLVR